MSMKPEAPAASAGHGRLHLCKFASRALPELGLLRNKTHA